MRAVSRDRHAPQRRTGLFWVSLTLGALGAAPASADGTVTTTSDSTTTGDGACSLREAIALAADCPGAAPSGATTITVPAGTYTLGDQTGRHRFTVRAMLAGKTDPAPASFRFRVVRLR